jgi:hypothetical protein
LKHLHSFSTPILSFVILPLLVLSFSSSNHTVIFRSPLSSSSLSSLSSSSYYYSSAPCALPSPPFPSIDSTIFVAHSITPRFSTSLFFSPSILKYPFIFCLLFCYYNSLFFLIFSSFVIISSSSSLLPYPHTYHFSTLRLLL